MTFTILVTLMCHTGPSHAQASQPSSGDEGPAKAETKLPMGPLLLGGFGVVTLAVGAGFAWQAWEENDDFNKKDVDGKYSLASDKLADDIEKHSIVANILMFGGTAVVAASLLWWLLDDDYDSNTESKEELEVAKWRPIIGPGQAGLTIDF
ncbi:MAG: hypothetical protein GY854_02965 [Deltaproteobacteria bacterium]|nr:hypothetical protein [Deltaproteobacteria bacterium]